MANVLEIIKNEITQDYYKNNFPNDGQRFVAWYMRNIHLLDQRQAKDAITDGALMPYTLMKTSKKYILYKGNTTLVNLLMQLL